MVLRHGHGLTPSDAVLHGGCREGPTAAASLKRKQKLGAAAGCARARWTLAEQNAWSQLYFLSEKSRTMKM